MNAFVEKIRKKRPFLVTPQAQLQSWRTMIFALLVLGGNGCGGDADQPISKPQSEAKQDMGILELGIGRAADSNQGMIPKGVNGLKQDIEGNERIIQKIESGEIVVNWNAPMATAKWWAYEKDAPIKGGYAILIAHKYQAKECTADEVKSAIEK
jgi:hypothetical protein